MDTTRELVELGKQSFENKDYARAERYFLQVTRSNNNGFADIHNMLGVIYHIEGKFESAINAFQKALKINPSYTEALLNLAVLYNDLGRYQEAKKLYGSLKKKHKSPQGDIEPVLRGKLSNLHADLGDIYRSIGLYRYAREEYKKGLEFNPSYVDIRTKYGTALREDGDLNGSARELKRAARDDPRYIIASLQLGITYYSQGKIKEAKREWENTLKQDPENESAKIYLKLCEKK